MRFDPRTLPWRDLSPSTAVDVCQWLACRKPAVRISSPPDNVGRKGLRSSLALAGLHFDEDDEFFCIARTPMAAARVLGVDRLSRPHTFELGRLLGYPPCCCRFAADHGEAALDELDARVGTWDFQSGYAVLDSSCYLQGHALISHIPCSIVCNTSHILAKRALAWLQENVQHGSSRPPWTMWIPVLKHFSERDDDVRL